MEIGVVVVLHQGDNMVMVMIDIEEVKMENDTDIRTDTTTTENDDDTKIKADRPTDTKIKADRLTDHQDGVRHLILNQGQDQDLMMIEIDEEITILLHEIITDVERIVRTNDARTTEEEEAVPLAFNLKVCHLKAHHLNVHHQEIITDVERIVRTNDARTREEEVVRLAFNLKVHHLNVRHRKHRQIFGKK